MNNVLLGITVFTLCGCLLVTTEPTTASRIAVQRVAQASVDFTLNLYKNIRSVSKDGDNVFFSPFSIGMGLAMLLNGANRNTYLQLHRAMGFKGDLDINLINQGFSTMLNNMQGNEVEYTLETANALYVQRDYNLTEAFVGNLTHYYRAPQRQLNFWYETEAARREINRFIEAATRKQIRDFIQPGALDPSTIAYLLNAIYFSGTWVYEFPVEGTKRASFYVNDALTQTVDMMSLETELHATNVPKLKSNSVLLPYQGKRLFMLLLVPEERTMEGFRYLEDNLNSRILKELLQKNNIEKPKVNLKMPRFKIEDKINLKSVLIKMGVTDVFTDSADLTNMEKNGFLKVSSASHKAVIDVDEKGTKAAAVTDIGIVPFFLPPRPLTITADRPFLLFIYDSHTKVFLFAGAIFNPKA